MMGLFIFKKNEDFSKWPQVSKLSEADIGKRRAVQAKFSEMENEADLLQKKLKALQARADAEKAEWWAYLRKMYGLKNDRDFHVLDDGRILMRP